MKIEPRLPLGGIVREHVLTQRAVENATEDRRQREQPPHPEKEKEKKNSEGDLEEPKTIDLLV